MWVHGRRIYAHRLAWLHITGKWPEIEIDHINGDGCDNRAENLRAATRRLNMENRRTAQRNNVIGQLGVSQCPSTGRYFARIETRGRSIHLGTYDTAEMAHGAYLGAKRLLHNGCTI